MRLALGYVDSRVEPALPCYHLHPPREHVGIPFAIATVTLVKVDVRNAAASSPGGCDYAGAPVCEQTLRLALNCWDLETPESPRLELHFCSTSTVVAVGVCRERPLQIIRLSMKVAKL